MLQIAWCTSYAKLGRCNRILCKGRCGKVRALISDTFCREILKIIIVQSLPQHRMQCQGCHLDRNFHFCPTEKISTILQYYSLIHDKCLRFCWPGVVLDINVMSPSIENSYKVSEVSHIFCMDEAKAGSAALFSSQRSMAFTRDTSSPEILNVIAEVCAIARSLHSCPCTASLTLSSKGMRSSTANATSLGISVSMSTNLCACNQASEDQIWVGDIQECPLRWVLYLPRFSPSLNCVTSSTLLNIKNYKHPWSTEKTRKAADNNIFQTCKVCSSAD